MCNLYRDLFGNLMNLAVCLSYFESLRSLLKAHNIHEAEVDKVIGGAASSVKTKAAQL